MKTAFDTKEYIKNITKGPSYFHTFINLEHIAAGILKLSPGEEDTQEPHESDEVYYVVKGNGFLNVKGKDYPVSDGMSFFVAKNVEHRFHSNTKDLIAVYFFSGPDS